jgi:hypothetical protein
MPKWFGVFLDAWSECIDLLTLVGALRLLWIVVRATDG